MFLTSVTIAGGALFAGAKVYREKQKKKATPWTYYAEKKGLTRGSKRQESSSSLMLLQRSIKSIQEKTSSIMLATSKRSQQLKEVSSQETSINEWEQVTDWRLNIALSSLALAGAGTWFYAPLSLASVPGLIYLTIPGFKESVDIIVKERKIKVSVVNTVVSAGFFLTGQFFACALSYVFLMLGQQLLLKVEDNSLKSTINLFGQHSAFVWLISDGVEVQIPFNELQVGDTIVVHAGEMIPADGTITDGVASIDQRMLTGEAQPIEASVGDDVLASTIVLSGQICIKVEKAGSDTVAAQITDILNRTTGFKEQLHWQWMKWLDDTAWLTLLSGAISLPLLGAAGALTVIYSVSFGYSMKILAPLSLLSFLNLTSQNSILIKDGRSLEALKQVDTIVFDKTGTLTEEVPTVWAIHSCNEYSENDVLTYAAAAEDKQTHPIALAITSFAKKRELTLPSISNATVEVGYGLKVRVEEKLVQIGSGRFMVAEGIAIPANIKKLEETCHTEGYSLVYVAIDNQLAGAIELHPTIRPEAQQITSELRQRHIDMVIISGDHEAPTQKLAESLGIEHYFAQVLPQDKANLIEQLQNEGKSVCFIGDGINDSIALKKANVSISMSGASTIATDSAGIILMDGTLNQFIRLLDIANELDSNLSRSSIMTIMPGVICVGGVLFFHFGIVSSLILFNMGLAASVSNALLPLIRHQREKSSAP